MEKNYSCHLGVRFLKKCFQRLL